MSDINSANLSILARSVSRRNVDRAGCADQWVERWLKPQVDAGLWKQKGARFTCSMLQEWVTKADSMTWSISGDVQISDLWVSSSSLWILTCRSGINLAVWPRHSKPGCFFSRAWGWVEQKSDAVRCSMPVREIIEYVLRSIFHVSVGRFNFREFKLDVRLLVRSVHILRFGPFGQLLGWMVGIACELDVAIFAPRLGHNLSISGTWSRRVE